MGGGDDAHVELDGFAGAEADDLRDGAQKLEDAAPAGVLRGPGGPAGPLGARA